MSKKRSAKKVKGFINDHWLKIAGGVISIGLGVFGWHIAGCLTDQKTQIIATRKAWIGEKTAGEKYNDDLAALIVRIDIYRREGQTKADQGGQQWKAILDPAQTLVADCNAGKAAKNEFSREFKELGRLFGFDVTKPPDVSCEGLTRLIQRFRLPNPEREKRPIEPSDLDAIIDGLKIANEGLERTKDQRIENDRYMESLFIELEHESYFRKVTHCF